MTETTETTEPIALDTYKELAAEINMLSVRVEALVKLRRAAMSNVASSLNLVLLENGMLRNISWIYKHIDLNYVVFEALKDHAHATLMTFLGIKAGTYADYDLKRTEDNDHVIITLSITPQQEQLYIDRDYISRVITEYRLVNICTDIVDAHITSGKDINDVLTSILYAVGAARYSDQAKGS